MNETNSELTRRLGFEYNGMVLHEYYFGNMKKGGSKDPERHSVFLKATEESFGKYETWKTDFMGVGKMRGVGWAHLPSKSGERSRVQSLDHAP